MENETREKKRKKTRIKKNKKISLVFPHCGVPAR